MSASKRHDSLPTPQKCVIHRFLLPITMKSLKKPALKVVKKVWFEGLPAKCPKTNNLIKNL